MSIWTPRTTVAAIVEQNGRFLMVEEEDGASGDTVINQPAGHLENGERLDAAAAREVLEETGWEIEAEALVGIYKWQLPATDRTYLRYCFSGRALTQRYAQPPDGDIIAAHWLTAEEIGQRTDHHRSPMVALCLADYLKGQRYPLDAIHELD